jgi:hypothetical protein
MIADAAKLTATSPDPKPKLQWSTHVTSEGVSEGRHAGHRRLEVKLGSRVDEKERIFSEGSLGLIVDLRTGTAVTALDGPGSFAMK